MGFVQTVAKQKLVLSELNNAQFPSKISGRIAYRTPMGNVTFDRINFDLTNCEIYLHPEHSFVSKVKTDEGDTVELIIHNDCMVTPHVVELPKHMIEFRAHLSWLNWNRLGGANDIINETQDSGERAIIEIFSWSSFATEIIEELLIECDREEKNNLWDVLINGQLAVVDFYHNCLIDLKHKSKENISSAEAYYKTLEDWAHIVTAQPRRT